MRFALGRTGRYHLDGCGSGFNTIEKHACRSAIDSIRTMICQKSNANKSQVENCQRIGKPTFDASLH